METTLFSGYKDKNSTHINHGDIVEFYFDCVYGHGDKNSGYTKMIDVCFFDKHENKFYLINGCGGGAFVWRHNEHCEVIGNIKTDSHLLNEFTKDSLIKMFPQLKN